MSFFTTSHAEKFRLRQGFHTFGYDPFAEAVSKADRRQIDRDPRRSQPCVKPAPDLRARFVQDGFVIGAARGRAGNADSAPQPDLVALDDQWPLDLG